MFTSGFHSYWRINIQISSVALNTSKSFFFGGGGCKRTTFLFTTRNNSGYSDPKNCTSAIFPPSQNIRLSFGWKFIQVSCCVCLINLICNAYLPGCVLHVQAAHFTVSTKYRPRNKPVCDLDTGGWAARAVNFNKTHSWSSKWTRRGTF